MVLVLEGGYNLESISSSFAECVRVLQAPTEATKAAAFRTAALSGGGGCSGGGGGGWGYLPCAYPGPLLPSPAAVRAVRHSVRHLEPFWRLRGPGAGPGGGLGGGFVGLAGPGGGLFGSGEPSDGSYPTCPRLVAQVPGRAWAFCFVGGRFSGRLARFQRARRWRRADFDFLDVKAADDESIASDDLGSDLVASSADGGGTGSSSSEEEEEEEEEEVEGGSSEVGSEEEAYWRSVNGQGDSEDDDSEDYDSEDDDSEDDDSEEDDSEEDDSEEDSSSESGSDEGRAGKTEGKNKKKKMNNNRTAFNFDFQLPSGVELVASEDSFTPFAEGGGRKKAGNAKAGPKLKK